MQGDYWSQNPRASPRTIHVWPMTIPSAISATISTAASEQAVTLGLIILPFVISILVTMFLLTTCILDHHRRAEAYRRRLQPEQYHDYFPHQHYFYGSISHGTVDRGSCGTLGTISEDEEDSEIARHMQNSHSYESTHTLTGSTRRSISSEFSASTYVDLSSDHRIHFQSPFLTAGEDKFCENSTTPASATCQGDSNKGRPRQLTPAVSPQTYPLRDRLKDDEERRQQVIAFVRQTNRMARQEVRRRSSSIGERELRFMQRAYRRAGRGKQGAPPAMPQLIRTSSRSCEDLLHDAGRAKRFFCESREADDTADDVCDDSRQNIEYLRL